MQINFKYTTIILSVLLIVTYTWHWNDIFYPNKEETSMSGMMMNGTMHKMPNGGMMKKDTSMSMDSMMMDMLSGMRGKSGTELEKVFLEEMIAHHQGAVDMALLLLKDKTIKPELAQFAQKIVTAQTEEIVMQKKWLKDWFGSTQ